MFDLFRSREKTTRYLLGGLLMLVAVSMVVTLIPGFGSGAGLGPTDSVIATIGKDDTVTLREVQMGLNDTIRGRQIPSELISVYAPQIVDQVVKERAIAYYARELGYKVSDDDVATVIQMMVPQLFEGGKFVGKEAYQQFLQSNNTTIGEFERQARMRAGLRRLESAVLEGMVVTPAEIEKEFRARNERVVLEYVKVDPEKLKSGINVTTEEINAHWNTSKSGYQIPEKRSSRLLVIDEAKVGESLKVDEADLRRYYENNKEQFRTQERVRARHILVKTTEKSKEEEEKLKQKAEGLLKQIKSGGDFAELAKKNSDDPGSATRGGELDWFTRGQMVKAFEDKAFSQKPKEISDLVKTEFGYHIIQTLEKEDAKLKAFDEVKENLQKERVKEQVYDRMTQIGDQARAALAKNPAGAEQLAQQLNIRFVKVDQHGRGTPFPEAGGSQELDDAISELKKPGDVTEVVQTQGNKLVIAVLDQIHPARQAELKEVEDQIRTTIRNERAQRLLAERSTSLMERVKGNGGDLTKAIAGMGLEVKKTPEFGRDGQAEGIGAANYLDEAFRRDPGSVFGPVNVGGANFVCRVVSKSPADMSKLNDQRFDILLKLKGQKAQLRRDLFEDGLLQHLKNTGVVKIHQDTLKRLVDSYKNS